MIKPAAKPAGTPIRALPLLGLLATCIAITPAQATAIDIAASTSGSVYHLFAYGSFVRTYGDMMYDDIWDHGIHSRLSHAFMRFRLDSVPDTCVFLSAELNYYQETHWNWFRASLRLIPNPDSLGAQDLYNAIPVGRLLAPFETTNDGWVAWPLDSSALTALDSCRGTGWISCAVQCSETNGGGLAFGRDSSQAPYLHVVYRSSGILDTQSVPAARPLLDIAPNPTKSAFVVAIHPTTRTTLTLCDVLGRTAELFSLDLSGRTRLDLRGLAPGVYMATLDDTMPLVSRKLVITR